MSSLWEDPYLAMDPLTYSAIIQLQLEDDQEFANTPNGKQREETLTDAELALQMHAEELASTSAGLGDRQMARDMATAVLRDGRLFHQAYQLRSQVARDHELAANLQDDYSFIRRDAMSNSETTHKQDPWTASEMQEKAAALSMYDPGSRGRSPPELVVAFGNYDEIVAESSTWAAARQTRTPRLGYCVSCCEDKELFDVARVPCKDKHEYCRECLAQLFELSMTDESLFPPRCDNEPIPLAQVRFLLPRELAKRFEAKLVELSTRDRVYCHDPRCSTFVPCTAIDEDDVGICPRCKKTTCAICKAPSHTGDRPEDTSLQLLLATAEAEQWQRCLDCKRFIELEIGCFHMT